MAKPFTRNSSSLILLCSYCEIRTAIAYFILQLHTISTEDLHNAWCSEALKNGKVQRQFLL